MFGFLLKKNFCDGWDNLLSVVITNLVLLFSGFGIIFLLARVVDIDNMLLVAGLFFLALLVLNVIAFAYSEVAVKIADFRGIHLVDFFTAIPGVLKDAGLFTVMVSVIIYLSVICFDYYFIQQTSIVGFLMGAIVLWLDVFLAFSLIWFIPIRATMHNKFMKCLRKCFIIFFDNTGFCIVMGIYNLLLIVLSIFFIGLMPSVAGIMIANCNALRLRLYKYDYLEQHPELKTKKERGKIPWDELLYDDRETLGPRKFKSFLFPWKEEK